MPKGKYAVLLTFDGDYDDMDDITKMDGVDNVVVNSDTTLRFSGSNCTKKIEMRLQLPNGEAAGLPLQPLNRHGLYQCQHRVRQHQHLTNVYLTKG